MTPESVTALVIRWVRLYTRGLPTPVARRRLHEMDADLHDHTAHERSSGTSERRIALGILSRAARGVSADLSWRQRSRPPRGALMTSFIAILATALGVAAVGVVAILYGESGDAPELILLGILLIVGAFGVGVRTAQRTR